MSVSPETETSTTTERQIAGVELDTHRWYCAVTITYTSGEPDIHVIGMQALNDGLSVYGSVGEWQKAHDG